MIEGTVSPNLEPLLKIGLKGRQGTVYVPAVVDTGFSGHLCLAQRYVDVIDLEFHHVERYELANGDIFVADVFRGRIVLGGEEREVDVIITASEDTLIGAALLKDYVLTIHYPQRRLTLARG